MLHVMKEVNINSHTLSYNFLKWRNDIFSLPAHSLILLFAEMYSTYFLNCYAIRLGYFHINIFHLAFLIFQWPVWEIGWQTVIFYVHLAFHSDGGEWALKSKCVEIS